jgi:hypothetical protein
MLQPFLVGREQVTLLILYELCSGVCYAATVSRYLGSEQYSLPSLLRNILLCNNREEDDLLQDRILSPCLEF